MQIIIAVKKSIIVSYGIFIPEVIKIFKNFDKSLNIIVLKKLMQPAINLLWVRLLVVNTGASRLLGHII